MEIPRLVFALILLGGGAVLVHCIAGPEGSRVDVGEGGLERRMFVGSATEVHGEQLPPLAGSGGNSDGPESVGRSERREVGASSVDSSASDPGALKHGEFGLRFSNFREVQEHALRGCLSFLPSREDHLAESLGWHSEGVTRTRVPYDLLASDGFVMTADAMQAADEVALQYENRIRASAEHLYDTITYYAEQYVEHELVKVPRDAELPRPDIPEVDEVASRYSSTSTVTCGLWKVRVDFRSRHYPDIAAAFRDLDRVRAERRKAVQAMLR